SRLVDSYSRPALVLTFEGEMAKGSGRSIDQFDLYEAISQLESLFERFGGHSHAAGFALKRKNFHKLKRAISEIGLEKLQSRDLRPVLEIDAEIDFSDVSWNLIKEVEALAPFGNGNPEPLFCTRSAEIVEARVVGEKHLKMLLRQDGKIYDAIGFSMGNRKPKVGHCIDIAYTPQLNRWQGHENIQLRLIDFRSPTT
ncbi:MAG TPA: single-stranded-DNA-specific exonuclease RecJ, partial [Desulfobacterales bacterium]|nr:single-stranded-DNA-specific exonuclease RecJ [Desulfobacterales bacterium]